MDNSKSNLATQLKQAGYSLTKSRIAVFNYLFNHGPITMRALLSGLDGRLDRASVYRTVKLFEDLGLVQRLSNGFKYSLELSDNLIQHHHHLVCVSCGRIEDITDTRLENYIDWLSKAKGFRSLAHQVEVRGYCLNCSH